MADTAHVDAIEALARASKRSVREVGEIYMEELAHLKVDARIQDYLVLLTSKHVRDVLRGASERKLSKSFPPQLPQAA
jgi:hypothetical protein